jgi:hypothetical protein
MIFSGALRPRQPELVKVAPLPKNSWIAEKANDQVRKEMIEKSNSKEDQKKNKNKSHYESWPWQKWPSVGLCLGKVIKIKSRMIGKRPDPKRSTFNLPSPYRVMKSQAASLWYNDASDCLVN